LGVWPFGPVLIWANRIRVLPGENKFWGLWRVSHMGNAAGFAG